MCVWGGGQGGGGKAKMRYYRTQLSGGSEGSRRPIFVQFFLLKKIGFTPYPDIKLEQTLP